MKLLRKTCVIISIVLSSAVSADEGIDVIGKAEVKAQPDQFSLTISIKERGLAASKVKQIVDKKSEQVVNMFIKQGVSESHIDSSMLRMYPIYEKPEVMIENAELEHRVNNNNKVKLPLHKQEQKVQKIRLFDVARTISVKLNSLEQYDSVLEHLVKIGVSNISPIQLGFSDPDALYQRALLHAIDNAKDKAGNIAKQLGVSVGKVISIKETGYHAPSVYRMAAMESKAGFSSQATDRSISAQVAITFQIIL
ncbi:SIMPL domain-containing protein [Thalassotalea sp. 1_MG-2023]|uniref:SIMPL domain-containing protein n=1 Tax=Thalassotalea sp. 1_MG-2023 TaxID=3062680 RepID=UPI0026E44B07|nr:SIMPL domain-containing protein [Thalassotalea sp. 1_MG-2023]MDO6426913.1 SIMPL domain-containing protein [Thalassotalea sp. 1_MG-2023]